MSEYKEIFNSLEPLNILEKITLFTGKRVEPGKTLLFFDEVQDCASAIMALRYFYEEMQLLHIIAAGSLVEFTLESENFRMPVGRIQYVYLFPMSFGELIEATGEKELGLPEPEIIEISMRMRMTIFLAKAHKITLPDNAPENKELNGGANELLEFIQSNPGKKPLISKELWSDLNAVLNAG